MVKSESLRICNKAVGEKQYLNSKIMGMKLKILIY